MSGPEEAAEVATTPETRDRPSFTVSAAAKATGKSRRTIGRMLDAGELDGATRDASGSWSIPVEALLGAGLAVHAPSPAPEPLTPTPPTSTPITPPVGTPTPSDESAQLRAALAEAEHKAELERVRRLAAEERATAAESDRDRWAEQAAALASRMLPATTEEQSSSGYDLVSSRENSSQPVERLRWWKRR